MMFDWIGKVVLITGAAKGIGAAVVKLLVESENVEHVTILDIDDVALALQNSLNLKYGENKVKYIKCDVTDDEMLSEGYNDVMDRYGRVDVVINNAGIMNDAIDFYKKQIDLNVTALCTSTLKALELMRQAEGGQGGTIINISSIAALVQHPLLPIYFATKSAVLHFSNCIGCDYYYARTGVRIITMCFGATTTGLLLKNNFGCFDKLTHESRVELLKVFTTQKIESAANSLVEAYKKGENGSMWLSVDDKPVRDITGNVKKAFELLSEGVL